MKKDFIRGVSKFGLDRLIKVEFHLMLVCKQWYTLTQMNMQRPHDPILNIAIYNWLGRYCFEMISEQY